MGNQNSSCLSQATQSHVDLLCGLTLSNCNSPAFLPFKPFAFEVNSTSVLPSKMAVVLPEDLLTKEQVGEESSLTGGSIMSLIPIKHQMVSEQGEPKLMTLLKKNQLSQQTDNSKRKTIKKNQADRPRPSRKARSRREQQMEVEEEVTPSSDDVAESGIRDQNNCKSYHKLVKNYLLKHNLAYIFDEYGVEYHTRYYFIVALIIIKYYLKQDFKEAYSQMVAKELLSQKRKIERLNAQKNQTEKELRTTKQNSRKYRELSEGLKGLRSKIAHVRVVIHEMENYSIRSCQAFFSGNTEESLRILYMKDDEVMRKKYYFQPALEIVKKIQLSVRKITSRRT